MMRPPRDLVDVLLVTIIRSCVATAVMVLFVSVTMAQGWMTWEDPNPEPRKTFPIEVISEKKGSRP